MHKLLNKIISVELVIYEHSMTALKQMMNKRVDFEPDTDVFTECT